MSTETLASPIAEPVVPPNNHGEAEIPAKTGLPGIVDDVLAGVEQRLRTQRLPTATYRVQLNHECTFRNVESIVPYLYTLGISDLYCSPFLQARPGSMHGYDVVNHAAINEEIGSLEDLRSLRSALREHDMGLIADVVPNHMAADTQLNAWWQDVLENGPSSSYASHFDIDWMPLKPDLADKVLLPVLGHQYGEVLEEGQLVLKYGEGAFWLEYFDKRLPISPRSYEMILSQRLEEFRQRLGEEHPELLELLSILTAIKNLPPRTEMDPDRLAERRREKEVIKRRLHELCQRSAEVAEFVQENVQLINGKPGNPRSFDLLDELLQDQAYRLAYWRVASDEINYRRFFDINELAAICTENPQVFAESHQLLFDLLDEGVITGFRIDHPDGLYDPRGYFVQLQEHNFLRLCRESFEHVRPGIAAGEDVVSWDDVEHRLLELWRSATDFTGAPLSQTLYIIVEKILAHNERLPDDWPVAGTVGYQFLNAVNGVFVEPRGERPLSVLYSKFSGQSLNFDELSYQSKRLIVRMSMASELGVLGNRLDRISERNRWTRDFTLNSLTRALQEVIACYRVYRSYVRPGLVLERDRHCINDAVARAKRRNPAMDATILDLVGDVLTLNFRENADEEERRAIEGFVGKFQQLTGPIMAKAVEDTTFYRFNRLMSLNEVGGEPARFGTSLDEFHELNQSRLPRYAHNLNASSTHDTKRSEDVRARINVISEIPKEWREHVQRWSRWNRKQKTDIDGIEAPSRNAEYLLYQTLVAIWPDEIPTGDVRETYIRRLQQYMTKVVREAKLFTSWISPNEPYEAAVSRFVASLFNGPRRQNFLKNLQEFAGKIADHGRWNSLSQLVLKIASPGVPDFYQGTELWNLALVDPDNRHPVDFEWRRDVLDRLLQEMATVFGAMNRISAVEAWLGAEAVAEDRVAEFVNGLVEHRRDGRIKLFCTLISLRLRRQFPRLFSSGEYQPLVVTGPRAEHVIAFSRRHSDAAAIVVVPRFTARLTGFGGPPPIGDVFAETHLALPEELANRPLQNVFDRATISCDLERRLAVSELLNRLPFSIAIAR